MPGRADLHQLRGEEDGGRIMEAGYQEAGSKQRCKEFFLNYPVHKKSRDGDEKETEGVAKL